MLSFLIIGVAGCRTNKQAPMKSRTLRGWWLTPETKVLVKVPGSKQLALNLEVPGWPPFDYPVNFKPRETDMWSKP